MARSNSANFSGDSNRKFAYPVYDRELLIELLANDNANCDAAHPEIHSTGQNKSSNGCGRWLAVLQENADSPHGGWNTEKCVNGV
jgi:hypothetical protein